MAPYRGGLVATGANYFSNTVSVLLNTGRGGTTPTLLYRFEAGWTSSGIELRWQLTAREPTNTLLQRGEADTGPWILVKTAGAEVLDRNVVPDRTYSYRLVTTSTDGRVQRRSDH